MHNLYAILVKFLEIYKLFGKNLTNERGNEPLLGIVYHFSDLEMISLSLTSESIGIDSENYLFAKLDFKKAILVIVVSKQLNFAIAFEKE